MKNKLLMNRVHTPLLALALATGASQGGTSETTTAPAPAAKDWLKVSGYAALAYTHTDVDGGPNNDTFADGGPELDVAKVGFEATQGPLTAYASLFYAPTDGNTFGGNQDAGILDAYVTYKVGDFSITGGKYLSWLGYEAFDTVNMYQLTYANNIGAIPAYHTGVKAEYTTDVFGAGLNVSDSIRGGKDGYWGGDGEFSDSIGFEGYFVYKGVKKLTVWTGFGYEVNDDPNNPAAAGGPGADWQTYDLWASYDFTDKFTLAAEVAYHDDKNVCGVQGLLMAKYAFTDKFSLVGRFGEDELGSGGPDAYRYTIAPTYAFNEHFLIRGELTYTDSKNDAFFSGAQALLKF